MQTEANLEKLNDSLDSFLRAGDFMTSLDPRGWILLSNRLCDAAIECGMSYREPNHVVWASARIAEWLCRVPLDEAA